METRDPMRELALALVGIALSLVLGILAAVQAPSVAILICAAVTLILILLLYGPVVVGYYEDNREEHERRRLRTRGKLRLIAEDDAALPPSELPDGVYGFEEVFAVAGIKSAGPSANLARLKPDRTTGEGRLYPLEVHKFDGETWLVGFVSSTDQSVLADERSAGKVTLSMQRTTVRNVLVEIPVSRVVEEQSLGDRIGDRNAKNVYRLMLCLTGN